MKGLIMQYFSPTKKSHCITPPQLSHTIPVLYWYADPTNINEDTNSGKFPLIEVVFNVGLHASWQAVARDRFASKIP